MTSALHEPPAILADADFVALKRAASVERAEAIKASGHAIVAWLRNGLRLRYSDDAITHPAAGKLCGC